MASSLVLKLFPLTTNPWLNSAAFCLAALVYVDGAGAVFGAAGGVVVRVLATHVAWGTAVAVDDDGGVSGSDDDGGDGAVGSSAPDGAGIL